MSDLELRLAALSKLVAVESEAVDERLSEEYARVEETLVRGVDYNAVSHALKTLAVLVVRYHMATTELLQAFVTSIEERALTIDGAPISPAGARHSSAGQLIREAIEVAERVAYVHTDWFIRFLLSLTQHPETEVAKKAQRALESLATFNLDVFYGDPPRGAEPQTRLVSHLSQLGDEALRAASRLVHDLLDRVLSPSIEGTAWTNYDTLTIRRSSVVNDGGVAEMRAAAIELGKRMYSLDSSIEQRHQALQTLDAACRREGGNGNLETSAMFDRDALTVLTFLHQLVATEPLQLVQSIEHQAYWVYYHSPSSEVKRAALLVRSAVDSHAEYQIYKQLIGFEGIFGDWEDLSRSDEAWEYSDESRRAAAKNYLASISSQNYAVWRDRILRFSETRSNDMATFPIFYDFLAALGQHQPDMALELLTAHDAAMDPFLISLMRGLWDSQSHAAVEAVAMNWIKEGRHLADIAKSLYKVGAKRLYVLRAVIERSAHTDTRAAVLQSMGVAASLFAEGAEDAKDEFMRALRIMTELNDASWANVVWFSRDFRSLVNAMSAAERGEVLSSLKHLRQLDYQAEDILYEIGKHDIQALVDFVIARLAHDRTLAKQRDREDHEPGADGAEKFEAIPYQFTKLNKLFEKAPAALLSMLRSDFDDEVPWMFVYRGVRLVRSTFPDFGPELERLLLQYVATGRDDDVKFVVGILRAYEGAAAILGVCKAIVKSVPERSKMWNEVAAAIETTGVVSGEFGLADAYEHKLESVSAWSSDDDERVRNFSDWLSVGLTSLISQERQRAEQGLTLRKYRFGGGDGA